MSCDHPTLLIIARRNKLVSLPPWLCLLDHLETLHVDDNPFAPEWLSIVNPILARSRTILPAPSVHSLNSSTTSSSIDRFAADPNLQSIAEDGLRSAPLQAQGEYGSLSRGNRLRKMRSAGTLLNLRSISAGSTSDEILSPTAISPPPLSAGVQVPSLPSSRFDSLGSAGGRRASAQHEDSRPGKWGFLRKMSMNRLKGEKAATLTASASTNVKLMPPPLRHLDSEPGPVRPPRPGLLTAHSAVALPSRAVEEEPLQPANKRAKRRSFLPIDPTPPSINIAIPSSSPFMTSPDDDLPTLLSQTTIADDTLTASSSLASELREIAGTEAEARYASGLESIKSYLRDLFDLSQPPIEPYGGFEVVHDSNTAAAGDPASPASTSISDRRRAADSRCGSSMSVEHPNDFTPASPEASGKKFKNDRHKRARVLREIYE